jgi:hypothetical protein
VGRVKDRGENDEWVPHVGSWGEGDVRRRMVAREVRIDMKEGILLVRRVYSVLKEKIKYDECGWSNISGSDKDSVCCE